MDWVYLSPHFDDVAFSCGGLVWEQSQIGNQVVVWTICAGEPPPGPLTPFAGKLHSRWGLGSKAVHRRRKEDEAACRIMKAVMRHSSIPDCIYRRSLLSGQPYYPEEGDIFADFHPEEAGLVDEIATILSHELPKDVNLVSPLALGDHVDHCLLRLAAERVDRPLWYYADYPYVIKSHTSDAEKYGGMEMVISRISAKAVDVWERAVVAHASQISSFWPDSSYARRSIREYYQQYNGVRLWRVAIG
jgi:LmbE family N-acetylglucosaminyl deacetylase